MPQLTVTNPAGVFGNAPVADYRTGKKADGRPLEAYADVVDDFLSAGVIAAGDLVNLVPPTAATTPPVWKQNAAAGADPITRQHGIALNATTAAGQPVKVCIRGLCLANVGAAGAPAVDLTAIRSATAGLVVQGATPDATTIVGTIFGVFFGAKDANNKAWLFVNQW